ncbi:MAG: DUF4783 domain-containing protein, partial [Rhodothermales bacterium]|nr:DUF4783 domain-containing protein [Rhodothermales bacterium]
VLALCTWVALVGLGPAAGAVQAQVQAPGPEGPVDTTALSVVQDAFATGNVDLLLGEAGDRVDIAIFGHGASYSRAQAALVLLDFFRRHPPDQVEFDEEAVASDRRSVIGRYWETGSPEPVAVFIRLRARDDAWQLRSIRIERGARR